MIKISSNIPGRIKIAFAYNPEYIAKIKTIKAHRWHPEEKHWSFPYSKPILKEILSAFSGEKLNIDPSLQALISRNQKETSMDLRTEPNESLPTKQGEAEKERLGWDNGSNSAGEEQ